MRLARRRFVISPISAVAAAGNAGAVAFFDQTSAPTLERGGFMISLQPSVQTCVEANIPFKIRLNLAAQSCSPDSSAMRSLRISTIAPA